MTFEAVKKYRNGSKLLEIFIDQDAASPREWDNLGKIVTAVNSHHTLGDDQTRDFEEYFTTNEAFIKMPVFMLDHSGVKLSLKDFSDPWDSGQVGWIYCTLAKFQSEYPDQSPENIQKCKDVFKSEIDVYSDYINGDVLGYQISEVKKCDLGHEHNEHEDSCWGYYGWDISKNGIASDVPDFEKYEEVN